MSNSIILFSSLFSSVYLMSISLGSINKSLLENKKISRELMIINGLTFVVSSYIFIEISLSNMFHKKNWLKIFKIEIFVLFFTKINE